MKTLAVTAATAALLISSCSKEQHYAKPVSRSVKTVMSEGDGKEDTDGPIIMENTRDLSGILANSSVTLVNGGDTLFGHTDATGECIIRLTKRGIWALTVTNSTYSPVITNVDIESDTTVRVDTLQ